MPDLPPVPPGMVRVRREPTATGRDHKLIAADAFDPSVHTLYGQADASTAKADTDAAEVNATPAALKILAAAKIDPAAVKGTGKDDRITKADAEAVVAEREAS